MAFIESNLLTLEECTPTELVANDPFYVEDIIRVRDQDDFVSLKKFQATLWGTRRAVWVGLDTSGTPLPNGIAALRCPPFYPQNSLGHSEAITNTNTPPGFNPLSNCEEDD